MRKCFLSTHIILPMLCFAACKQRNNIPQRVSRDTLTQIASNRSAFAASDNVTTNAYLFIADSVMHGHRDLVKYYFIKYHLTTRIFEDTNQMKQSFEGYKPLGGIKRSGKKDSVFVYGESYYFTDTTLPRLKTDSHCCHPDNIFSVGDIDEDGVLEIGQYYSSCESHYKSLYVWTLKNNEWKQIGHSVFDQHYMTYDKPFSSFVRKTGKGKFEMHEISDLSDDSTKKGIDAWLKFSF